MSPQTPVLGSPSRHLSLLTPPTPASQGPALPVPQIAARAAGLSRLRDVAREAAAAALQTWFHGTATGPTGTTRGHDQDSEDCGHCGEAADVATAAVLTVVSELRPKDTPEAVRARLDQIAARLTPQDWEWLQTRATQPGLLKTLRALHAPWAIFGYCDCTDKTTPAHVHVDEIGATCNRTHFVCEHCCLDVEFDTETACCVDYHSHGPDKPICATTALLDQYGGAR